MAVTIYEVAQRAGVSSATVSRALRDDPRISETTRRAVQAAAAELHYLPRAAASSLARGSRTNALGLVLPHIDGAYYADLLVGFETAASERGLSVILTLARPDHDARSAVRALAAQVDGVAFGARSGATDDLVDQIGHMRPVVTGARGRIAGHDAFFVENEQTALRLARHLVDNGRRRIAFVGSPERGSDLGMRHAGYVAAMEQAGLEPVVHPVFPTETEGRRLAERLVDDGLGHDALMCGNDEIALAVMDTLQRRGVRVPDDVAITGWDDSVTARYVRPGLTTISQPVRRLGWALAERLAQRVQGDAPIAEDVILPATLAHRSSCGCVDTESNKELP